MASKNIILESLINFEAENGGELNDAQKKIIIEYNVNKYHKESIRENARHAVNEFREKQERLVHQISHTAYFRVSRPYCADAAGRDILCRNQEHREDSKDIAESGTQKIKKNWF